MIIHKLYNKQNKNMYINPQNAAYSFHSTN